MLCCKTGGGVAAAADGSCIQGRAIVLGCMQWEFQVRQSQNVQQGDSEGVVGTWRPGCVHGAAEAGEGCTPCGASRMTWLGLVHHFACAYTVMNGARQWEWCFSPRRCFCYGRSRLSVAVLLKATLGLHVTSPGNTLLSLQAWQCLAAAAANQAVSNWSPRRGAGGVLCASHPLQAYLQPMPLLLCRDVRARGSCPAELPPAPSGP